MPRSPRPSPRLHPAYTASTQSKRSSPSRSCTTIWTASQSSAYPTLLCNSRQLYRAFTDAVTPHDELHQDYYRYHPRSDDTGYLAELASTVRRSVARLPAAAVIAEAAQRGALRCAEAQTRIHATPCTGTSQLELWARSAAASTALRWQEFLAGSAASVLSLHALIAAAADPLTTNEHAREIDTTYLNICALSTILDSLVDHEQDKRSGTPGYIRYYKDRDDLSKALADLARDAAINARTLPNAAHHTMTLVGVVAYYTSAPSARGAFAGPVTARLHHQLQPLITPTLAVMRTWRAAKQIRSWR